MIEHRYFDMIFFIVLIFHMIVLNDIKPKTGYLKDTNVNGNILVKLKDGIGSNIDDFGFSKIEDGVMYIYNNEYYTQATKVNKINIYNTDNVKLKIRKISHVDDFKKDLYKDLYGFNIYRLATKNEPEINIDIFLQTIEERDKWIDAIEETENVTYGKQSDGSVVLNDIQTEIKKYLDESKNLEKIIYGDSSPKDVKEATAKLISIRSKLNNQIKKYENPKNLEDILKGETLDIKDITTCNCSIGKLRTTTMYLNAILPSSIIIIFAIQYFNTAIYNTWLYKKIVGVGGKEFVSDLLELFISRYKIFLYAVFFIIATSYHAYLLSSCQCSISSQTQKGYSFFFMLLFPIILVTEAVTKATA